MNNCEACDAYKLDDCYNYIVIVFKVQCHFKLMCHEYTYKQKIMLLIRIFYTILNVILLLGCGVFSSHFPEKQ